MKLAVLDPNSTDHWMEVHKAGCADLKKRDRHGVPRGMGAWTLEADNLTDATWAVASDFIAERDEPEAESVAEFRDQHIYWAPCVVLPKEAPEPEVDKRIATVAELRSALEGMDDDLIVMVDGYIYIGPRSAYGEESEDAQ